MIYLSYFVEFGSLHYTRKRGSLLFYMQKLMLIMLIRLLLQNLQQVDGILFSFTLLMDMKILSEE